MKKMFVVFAVLLGIGATDARAQETNISVDASLDVVYAYIWRGAVLGSDKDVALQPSLTFGFGESGIALNVWGSAFLKDRSSGKSLDQADELDFTLSFDRMVGADEKVGLSLGYIQYTFPSLDVGTNHTEEFYGGLSYDHQIAPSITFYYDFGVIDDFYVTAGISPEFPLGEQEGAPTLGIGASVAFSGEGYGGESGFNDFTVTASIGWERGNWSFGPFGGYSYADDGVNADNSSFWGGVSVGFSK